METVAKHHEMVWARGSVNTKHSLAHRLKRNLYSVVATVGERALGKV